MASCRATLRERSINNSPVPARPASQTNGVKKNVIVIKVGTSSLLRQDKNCIHLSQVRTQAALGPGDPSPDAITLTDRRR